ncbi:exonuclease SbcCD subunit D [Arthrobacter castelli]|uniref:exonuclease SbcCD subunit D n=1 Tax=Arthrobacter castelli TaxID=271431 RepID=UPI0004062DAD|nr:exonuclease SbcCD subunit D [Arthrobacter castelli]
MRILHTSDWHLGRSFHGVGMLDAQRRFVDQLVTTVIDEEIDVVLIAGDVYDRALPAVDVVNLLDDALVRITAAGARVVLSSGNHDSAARLGFASRLLESGGVHLRTRIGELDSPVLIDDAGVELAIYGIPYLEPRLAAGELDAEATTHAAVIEAAMGRIRADLEQRGGEAGGPLSIVLAHTFASGGITADSERDLAIGGVGAVPLDAFDDIDYVALGHLHGRQQLSKSVRYAGSPLPYSFSEAGQAKGGWLIEAGPSGIKSVEPVHWPAERQLAVLRGNLEDLLTQDSHTSAEDSYCQITLTDAERPKNAMERVRSRFPHTLVLGFDPEGGSTDGYETYGARIAKARGDLEISCGFVEHVRGRAVEEGERELLAAALDRVREEELSR